MSPALLNTKNRERMRKEKQNKQITIPMMNNIVKLLKICYLTKFDTMKGLYTMRK